MESPLRSVLLPGRFFADAMLGKLALWLRILGYDTAYERVIEDERLVERMLSEDRWLVTRDSYLVQRRALRGRHTLVRSDHLEDQLRQLQRELELNLDPHEQRPYRCAHCNVILQAMSRERAVSLVPHFVAAQHSEFVGCPLCGRVYWPGTHWTNLCRQLEQLTQT